MKSLPAVNAMLFIGGLTSEGHSGKVTDIDMAIVRASTNPSCRKKDLEQIGTRGDSCQA